MDKLKELQHLSLVSKVTTELENHLGIGDKTLAEFIIQLAEANRTVDKFSSALEKNGAELSRDLCSTLLNVINHMRPGKKAAKAGAAASAKPDREERFPGLALPDNLDHVKKARAGAASRRRGWRFTRCGGQWSGWARRQAT